MELRFNEVAGDWPNLFIKWRVRYIENLDITNMRGNDQNVRYIEVIVNENTLVAMSMTYNKSLIEGLLSLTIRFKGFVDR